MAILSHEGAMAEALFSDFLMIDRGPAGASATTAQPGPGASARPSGTDMAAAGGKKAQEVKARGNKGQDAFAQALVEALVKTLPRDASLLPGSPAELEALAAAMADIVSGRSVILRLKSDVAGYQRAAVKTFLEKLVRVTGNLEASRQE